MNINNLLIFILGILLISCSKENISVVSDKGNERIAFGNDHLVAALENQDYKINNDVDVTRSILMGTKSEYSVINKCAELKIDLSQLDQKESYLIKRSENEIVVVGYDASGVLYGCLELADKIKEKGDLPAEIDVVEKPEMVMRGTCIGLQKTEYLPGRHVYEYPYTPENFPWFYDKEHWIEYLDMLVGNRMNSLYLWNGHPFASLVKLEDYPYAVEVDEETFKLNEEMFGFITREADKRGIWVIQMFYNIIVSKPFAEHHKIKTQDRSRPITPLISDFTRKSIAAFIEKYPNVGLMVCLGEAMNTVDDDVEWFTETVIPGVQDGLKLLGINEEPPVILRGHDTDAKRVMEAALPIYQNLYTTHKYNGESLTTYEPRDSWASIHQGLSALGSVHISNVHILANLEPFRYGSPDFIQKSVKAMHEIQGANGLHLYPQSGYWDWPYTADKTNPRLKQIDRDWIWYKAWARYAWNSQLNRDDEISYWTNQLGDFYGCGENGREILKAYEETGEIAPKLLRRFGISDGNRQTLLLGMFMSQLVNPFKWHVYQSFLSSNGPEGEIIIDYARKEWEGAEHRGELPTQIIEQVEEHGKLAVEAIEKASGHIKSNEDEFERLKNDVYCYNAFANFMAEKVKAALLVAKYKYSKNINDLEKAVPYLEKSIEFYTKLTNLTKDTYLYANSMQTQQRRIPISGRDGKNKTWAELLPLYQDELENFKQNINSLKTAGKEGVVKKTNPVFVPSNVEILNKEFSRYNIKGNKSIYEDKDYKIHQYAEELGKLKGVRLNFDNQREEGTTLKFRNEKPIKVLVGYFNGNSYKILDPPTLETNANANDRGQADIKIANALEIPGLYPVNVYSYSYAAGENELILGKGIVLILGFIDEQVNIIKNDAGLSTKGKEEAIDWLFY